MEPTPLTPAAPQDPHTEAPKTPEPQGASPAQSGAGHIDIASILLPKKEAPGTTVDSAQRVNAGVLLEQEQQATLKEPAPSEPAAPVSTPGSSGMSVESPVDAPIAPSAKKEEEVSNVKPIETYQRDIETLVKDTNLSVLSIAAAEAERRGSQQANGEPSTSTAHSYLSLLKHFGMYVLGFALLVAASGVLAYIVERPTSVSTPQVAAVVPFIAVDDTKVITIASDTTRSSFISTLTAAKQATALSLGLISQLLVTVASTTSAGPTLEPISAQNFFALIAPDMPQDLLRTIRPSYLLGVHVYNDNQPFLILSVDSYEQAYAGMLAWEPDMQQDLTPLFNYTPTVHIPEQGVTMSTTTPTQLIQTGFVDKIVENHDARVIQNSTGDISLLWTFLDRNTLVITTNDATLREIISRLKQAPVTPIPAQ